MKNRPNTSATTFKQNNQKPHITQQNDIEPRFTLFEKIHHLHKTFNKISAFIFTTC